MESPPPHLDLTHATGCKHPRLKNKIGNDLEVSHHGLNKVSQQVLHGGSKEGQDSQCPR
jgi:hypothetical protein